MSLLKAKCSSCGGTVKLDDSLKIGTCAYCGSKMIVQDAIESHLEQIKSKLTIDKESTISNLLKRASQCFEDEKLNLANNFYNQVIDLDAGNHLAWWGKFLIKQKTPAMCIIVNGKPYPINSIKSNNIEKILGETGINVQSLVDNPEIIKSLSIPFWEDNYAKRAIKYADGTIKDEYQKLLNERHAVHEKKIHEYNMQVMHYINSKEREEAEKLEKEKREAEKRAYNYKMDNLSEATKKVGGCGCLIIVFITAVATLGVRMVSDDIEGWIGLGFFISIGFLLTSVIIKFMKKK